MKNFFTCILLTCILLILPYSVYGLNDSECDLFKEDPKIVQVFNDSDKTLYITDNDVYLMSQVVYAESNSEPYNGKVAVASVILNRLREPGFPKTIEGVIKQKGAFSCVKNGKISVVPDENSYRAVLDALKGNDPTSKAVFFYNPKIATSEWMFKIDKCNITTIGNHVFFKVD
jgi:N-acetylmuramoyl-L-alanine amidase